MPTGLLPTPAPPDAAITDPRAVAEAMLEALAAGEVEKAASFMAPDVIYQNVGLPTVRGRDEVRKALAFLGRPAAGFEVYLHSISADGPVVLTERTDVLSYGPFRSQFWVWGRFEVDDGLITVWRDYFDYLDITRGLLRGLAGMAIPSLRPTRPGPNDTPGR